MTNRQKRRRLNDADNEPFGLETERRRERIIAEEKERLSLVGELRELIKEHKRREEKERIEKLERRVQRLKEGR